VELPGNDVPTRKQADSPTRAYTAVGSTKLALGSRKNAIDLIFHRSESKPVRSFGNVDEYLSWMWNVSPLTIFNIVRPCISLSFCGCGMMKYPFQDLNSSWWAIRLMRSRFRFLSWVLVDFDRRGDLKKAGPATNAEKEHLYNQARRALVWLTMNGFVIRQIDSNQYVVAVA
jgi:hypothetical protein